jgi:hypothetical protein
VTVIDYRNAEPELATVERLAEALLARIGRVQEQGGAGLSTQALRLTPIDVWIEGARLRDFYVRQGGMDEHTFGQLAASVREDGVLPTGSPTASSGVPDRVDTYMFWTPVGDGDPIDLPLYVVWLDRYRSAERADAEISRLSTDLGPGYIDVHEFLTRERIGDQSRHFAYRFEGDPSGVVRGHLVVARFGNVVVRTQVDGPQGVRAAGVEELAAAQIDCLRQEVECPPMPYLDALAALVTDTVLP